MSLRRHLVLLGCLLGWLLPIVQDAPAQAQTPPAAAAPAGAMAAADTAAAPASAASAPGAGAVMLHAVPAAAPREAVLGSNASDQGYKIQYHLTPYGAGIWWASLTDYLWKPLGKEPYAILTDQHLDGAKSYLYALAARSVQVDGREYDLSAVAWELATPADADPLGQATYFLRLADAQNRPVLEINRTFTLTQDSYELVLRQHIVNLDGQPHQVVWKQVGLSDIAPDVDNYLGDRRQFIAGYYQTDYDPARANIFVDSNSLEMRSTVLKEKTFWPRPKLPAQAELAWLAATNRYFAVALHPVTPAGAAKPSDVPLFSTMFPPANLQVEVTGADVDAAHDQRVVRLLCTTATLALAPGQTANVDLALFAGPRSPVLFQQPHYQALGFPKLVIYNIGGMCGFCTFAWLADILFYILNWIRIVVHDWGLAIIVLVIVVRAVLHPLTKHSQINMAKMQKQTAQLAPEIDKLKKKYKDDPKALQAEQMRLYREKGINPLGMVGGCLPMFLQMPIWVALYAMLYYAIELRQTPAFYGVFQALSGGKWGFLADLSRPDAFIALPESWWFNLPLLGTPVHSVNALPMLLGVVYFLQSKYASPPPANEQAAQQQQMMKWMTLFMPVLFYAAPSGLTLYMSISTVGGILDGYVVRRHIKREEEAGTLFAPKAPKPGGWTARLQALVEERQKAMQGGKTLPPRNRRER